MVGLSLKEPGISFVIGRSFWRQGYATEAARAVLRFGFDVKGFSEIASEFVVGNSGSRRVHDKHGFQLVTDFIDQGDGAECERHILNK